MRHPEDLVPRPSNGYEYINTTGFNLRYIARVPFRASDRNVTYLSFIVDSGSPDYMYLSHVSRAVLNGLGLESRMCSTQSGVLEGFM